MSLVQNLIKKAFATANANEAASFLASACNRMKMHNKEQIQMEVSAALVNVNLAPLSEKPSEVKTVYQDSPETLKRLNEAELLSARLRAQLHAAQQKKFPSQENAPGSPIHLHKFEKQVTHLRQTLDINQQIYLKESALIRSTMQREIDELKNQLNQQKASECQFMGMCQREKAELHQRLEAADALIKAQQEARYATQVDLASLHEELERQRADHHFHVEQGEKLNARLTQTIDELFRARNQLSEHFSQYLRKK